MRFSFVFMYMNIEMSANYVMRNISRYIEEKLGG